MGLDRKRSYIRGTSRNDHGSCHRKKKKIIWSRNDLSGNFRHLGRHFFQWISWRTVFSHCVYRLFLRVKNCEPLAQALSRRTTPCRLSLTAFSQHPPYLQSVSSTRDQRTPLAVVTGKQLTGLAISSVNLQTSHFTKAIITSCCM